MNACSTVWLTLREILAQGPRLVWQVPAELSTVALSRRLACSGVAVAVLPGETMPLTSLGRFESALTLIAEVEPLRFRRLQSDVKRFLITDTTSSRYLRLTRTCVLPVGRVLESSRERLALTIVHEATHARIARAGVLPTVDKQARIEQRCVKEEIRFLNVLKVAGYNGTDDWAAHLMRQLDIRWWTEDYRFRKANQELVDRGAPNWLVKLHRVLFGPIRTRKNGGNA